MMVDVRIVTKTSVKPLRLNMVYDTGAGTTTISRQVALNAGYKVKKNDDLVDGVGGRVKADYTVIPDLILSGVSLGPVYAYVVDFHKELARKTEALLGMNVLSWFKITFGVLFGISDIFSLYYTRFHNFCIVPDLFHNHQ